MNDSMNIFADMKMGLLDLDLDLGIIPSATYSNGIIVLIIFWDFNLFTHLMYSKFLFILFFDYK